MVPTVDTVRYEFFMSAWLGNQQPLLFVGPVGGGKSCMIQRHLKQRKEKIFCAALSASTSSRGLQELLESRLEKRSKVEFTPKQFFLNLCGLVPVLGRLCTCGRSPSDYIFG